MALLPYLLDCDMRPRRIRDQLFGLDLSPDDFMTDVFDRPRLRSYMRPWRNLNALAKDAGSSIKADKDKFQINLDVQHFSPEEISVKVADGHVVVEGQHEEKQDDHGFISRRFKRRYALPETCNPDMVVSKLSSDGVLSVIAPKTSGNERAIPVMHTGPVRRKSHEEIEANSESETRLKDGEEQDAKSPQKKRKR